MNVAKHWRIVLSLVMGMLCASTHSAQTGGGVVVPIEPCAVVYGTVVTTGTPLHLEVRGYCGVPDEAVAVFLNMKAGGSPVSGKAYLWPYGAAFPPVSQFNYNPNTTPGWPSSGQALVRLRSPSMPGWHDLTVQTGLGLGIPHDGESLADR